MREREIRNLLSFRREPLQAALREHRVEQHQPLYRAAERKWPAVSIVCFANGLIERLVMDVEQSGRVVATPALGCKAAPNQLVEEFAYRRATVRDSRIRRVIASEAHTGMQHDSHQEAR